MNYPKIVRIKGKKRETTDVTTLRFEYDREVKPGQFFMVWIPSVDEVPMSVSYCKGLKGITVKRVGEATDALHRLKVGDKIGIRGPYGKGFKITGRKLLAVGGGTGIISLAPAVEVAKNSVVILGAKTKRELIFVDRIKEQHSTLRLSTEDGTEGVKRQASEVAEDIVKKEKFSQIITCGPELMMKKILHLGMKNHIPVQASLERYMKCGIGICDACAINGYHVCKDGPVFDGKVLLEMNDFGKYKRGANGRRVKVV